MSHHPREDAADTWHHVMNRGIAKRTVFENSDDIRFFLSRIAQVVRRKEIEIHAYSILPNHYHLLIRSLRGEMSRALMKIQGQYVRWFNFRRKRDGPLFRGRFRSCKLSSDLYWRILIRYIDQNAVDAGIVDRPEKYPHCSAYYYAKHLIPTWLEGRLIMDEIRDVLGENDSKPGGYSYVFGDRIDMPMKWLVEERISNPPSEDDQLDDLVKAAPAFIKKWMAEKAKLADGSQIGQVLVDPAVINDRINKMRKDHLDWCVRPSRGEKSGWKVLKAGLFRMISGLSNDEISRRLDCSHTSTFRYIKDHAILLQRDEEYANYASRIAHESLRDCFG